MQGSALGTSYQLTHLICTVITALISQMGYLRPREVKRPVRGHPACQWSSGVSSPAGSRITCSVATALRRRPGHHPHTLSATTGPWSLSCWTRTRNGLPGLLPRAISQPRGKPAGDKGDAEEGRGSARALISPYLTPAHLQSHTPIPSPRASASLCCVTCTCRRWIMTAPPVPGCREGQERHLLPCSAQPDLCERHNPQRQAHP